jgi:hypothetical protein
MYHGMAQGLARLSALPAKPEPVPASTTDPDPLPAVESETALIRHLANMVLTIQSEVQHVY